MRRLWRPVLDGLIPYDAGLSLEALARELGRSDLVRLSANENPLTRWDRFLYLLSFANCRRADHLNNRCSRRASANRRGYRVIRLTWRALSEEPMAVAVMIARALERGAL